MRRANTTFSYSAAPTRRRVLTITWLSFLFGASAGAFTSLRNYIRREVRRRTYPTWDTCHCDFKSKQTIFHILHSQHEQRGETIFAEEWGLLLSNPPLWLRHLLHHGSQIMATLNPRGAYVERVELSPQEARQHASLLRTSLGEEEPSTTSAHIVWRREVLYAPQHIFDKYIRRLYPTHITHDRIAEAQPLPALWDPQSNLPLPAEGVLLETPVGTRIDCIGWTPSQISYCTIRKQSL